jgi:hypothetical protein
MLLLSVINLSPVVWPVSLCFVVCTEEQNDSNGNVRSWNIYMFEKKGREDYMYVR